MAGGQQQHPQTVPVTGSSSSRAGHIQAAGSSKRQMRTCSRNGSMAVGAIRGGAGAGRWAEVQRAHQRQQQQQTGRVRSRQCMSLPHTSYGLMVWWSLVAWCPSSIPSMQRHSGCQQHQLDRHSSSAGDGCGARSLLGCAAVHPQRAAAAGTCRAAAAGAGTAACFSGWQHPWPNSGVWALCSNPVKKKRGPLNHAAAAAAWATDLLAAPGRQASPYCAAGAGECRWQGFCAPART
jgi:hypothetical protein